MTQEKRKLGYKTSEDQVRQAIREELDAFENRLNQRLDDIGRKVALAGQAALRLREFLVMLVEALAATGTLQKDAKVFAEGWLRSDLVLATLDSLKEGNPFTAGEVTRLRHYYELIQKGYSLDEEQLRDFYDLSGKAAEEKPADQGAWVLALAAAFLLGLYLGSKKAQGAA